MAMISDLDKIKLLDLPIEQVAEALGMNVVRHKALCPFHDDTHPSLNFNVRTNRYHCYVCGTGGRTIDLVMHTLGLNFRESCHWLAHRFGLMLGSAACIHAPHSLKPAYRVMSQEPEPGPDVEYLRLLMARPVINEHAARFLYDERRINPEVVQNLGLSSISSSHPMSSTRTGGWFDGPALLIPYRDPDGRLISVQSRYLGSHDRPRFRFPKGSRCHIFNTDSLKGLDLKEPVYITEGVTDCMALLSAGLHAIAIPSATLLKRADVECFRERNLHMFPDADEPGERLFSQLSSICPQLIRHSLPAGFKDVGQYYAFIHRNLQAV